jgi:hypothetical protein
LTADNGILTKTFGTGIAYPLRTNDGMIIPDAQQIQQKGGNPRADSFSLYLNFVADTILKNILPKTKIENKLHKTLRVGEKASSSQQPNKSATVNPSSNGSFVQNSQQRGTSMGKRPLGNSLQTGASNVTKDKEAV